MCICQKEGGVIETGESNRLGRESKVESKRIKDKTYNDGSFILGPTPVFSVGWGTEVGSRRC